MRRTLPLTFLVLALLLVRSSVAQPLPPPGPVPLQPAAPQPAPDQLPEEPKKLTPQEKRAHLESLNKTQIAPVLQATCYSCHGDKKAVAGLNLQRLTSDFTNPATVETWQRVYERVRDGEMPPREAKPLPAPKPKEAEPSAPAPLVRPKSEVDDIYEARESATGILELFLDAADQHYPQELGTMEPLVIRGEDSSLLRLQKQMRNAALKTVQYEQEAYNFGTVTLEVVLDALMKFCDADLTVASTAEQRIASLVRAVAASRMLERYTFDRFRGGRSNASDFYAAKRGRLEAQVRLQFELSKKPK